MPGNDSLRFDSLGCTASPRQKASQRDGGDAAVAAMHVRSAPKSACPLDRCAVTHTPDSLYILHVGRHGTSAQLSTEEHWM